MFFYCYYDVVYSELQVMLLVFLVEFSCHIPKVWLKHGALECPCVQKCVRLVRFELYTGVEQSVTSDALRTRARKFKHMEILSQLNFYWEFDSRLGLVPHQNLKASKVCSHRVWLFHSWCHSLIACNLISGLVQLLKTDIIFNQFVNQHIISVVCFWFSIFCPKVCFSLLCESASHRVLLVFFIGVCHLRRFCSP